ncbi:DUF6252 family protein [Mucilaginibacter flavidus]|uniref:DUF6252 family protein n=1 Tax=Mucilaginibacter flavidus TaxID=2949309 RepID=UPI0020936F46|nr:DUF6252 family protein [Mucilaginibacter flavidus]MCO5947448.1 DUF6252 family protein [Mucilaginibacter flavidus]
MKKLLLAVPFICCLVFTGCKKDNQNVVNDLFMGAFKNGQAWVGQPFAGYLAGKDSVQVGGFKATGEETLYFNLKALSKGTYTIKPGQAVYFTTIGMDAVTGNYKIDATLTNTVTIRDFNVATNIVNGTFLLNFVKVSGAGPDKLSFTEGKFYALMPQ